MTNEGAQEGVGRRAIYLLPNTITTLALFSGFVSVVSSVGGDHARAGLAILAAALFDALDGRVARLTRTASPFGVQYDSLSDIIAFGAAPALLMYTAVLKPLGRFGWLGAFMFLACGALRLARYNIQAQRTSGRHFTGLPIPAAAALVASGLLLLGPDRYEDTAVKAVVVASAYALSLMMVSTVPYPSLKQVVIPRRRSFQALAGVVIFLVIMANYPIHFIFGFFLAYASVGPVVGPWVLARLGAPDVERMESFTLEDEDILENGGEEVVTRHGA